MTKIFTMLHTTPVIVRLMSDLAGEILPAGVSVRNVVDDSLLDDTREAGRLTKDVIRRFVGYVLLAESHGSGCIMLTCSSISPAVDIAREIAKIPILKIDEPMAETAAAMGNRVAVIATVSTTLEPTSNLIKAVSPKIEVSTVLCDDAFDALTRGDAKTHNAILLRHIQEAANDHDAVVLAQASMSGILPLVADEISHKVLTSPRLGMRKAAEVLAAV